jgi:hypothetical protein
MKNYSVKRIETWETKEWLLKKHYARRIPPIEHAFGVFDENLICQGVCTFGTPVSHTLRSAFGDEFKLFELNRLVLNEGHEKNLTSFFVGQCLKMIPSPCIIASYADTSKGHHGFIYQATNWVYTGLSAPFKDYYIRGMEHLHNGTIMDMSRGQENRIQWLRDKFGDDLIMIDRPRKHRYFYFVGDKRQKKQMAKLLPYSVEPYPKGENSRYDASYQVATQGRLF